MRVPPLKINFSDEQRKWILENIDQCLVNGQLVQGKYVKEFEQQFADSLGISHAVAVNSGTSAIEIMMRILGVEGKEVIVPTNTFIATTTGVLFAGGKIRFADIDSKTFSISLEEIKRRVTENTVGVIIVHIGGIITPEIEAIQKWCSDNNLWLFEDAAHAQGSFYKGKSAGSFGIAGSFSFFATKVMTTCEGGMVVTNDSNIAKQVELYRNHGKPDSWVSYHTVIGSNWRMTEFAAIIGLSQLEKMEQVIERRSQIASRYTCLIREYIPDITIIEPQNKTNWYKYIVLLPKVVDRDRIRQKMSDKGIGLQGEVYLMPLHKQPVFAEMKVDRDCPVAEDICSRHICLPLFTDLTDDQIKMVISSLEKILVQERERISTDE